LETNWGLVSVHHFGFGDIEAMMPWERQVYVDLIANKMQEERRVEMEAAALRKSMMKGMG
jgi:hypothetical protein